MKQEQLDKIRALLKESLPGKGFILFIQKTPEGGTEIVSNVCKDHFIKIMERIFKAAEEQADKNG